MELVDALLEVAFAIPHIDALANNERQQREHREEYQLVASIIIYRTYDDELTHGIEDGEVGEGGHALVSDNGGVVGNGQQA